MLTNPDYNYRNEFADINTSPDFSSTTGKTIGFNAPHEFWYFWRLHFNLPEVPVDQESFFKTADFASFNSEIGLMQQAFGRPLVMKAHICTPYLESFAKNMKNVVFVHLRRDPIANIMSLLKARITWNNSVEQWFSGKPREYHMLKEMDYYHQVAGQLYFKERQILDKRHVLGERYIGVTYESLCYDPEGFYMKMANLVNKHIQAKEDKISSTYGGPAAFNMSKLKQEFDVESVAEAYTYFEKKYGALVY